MQTTIQELMARHYAAIVVPDVDTQGEPCYVAYHPELEGCMSHGYTVEEALANLSEARRLYLSTLLEKGLAIPAPNDGPRVLSSAIWQVVTPSAEGRPEETTVLHIPAFSLLPT